MAFGIGQTVSPTTLLNVRATPSIPSARPVTVDAGVRGIIVGGPVSNAPGDTSGFTWWQINYASGVAGWSAEPYLAPVVAPPPPAPVDVQLTNGALLTLIRRPASTGAPAQLTVDPDAAVTINGVVS